MIRWHFLNILYRSRSHLIHLIKRCHAPPLEHFNKLHKNFGSTCRIVHRTVMIIQRYSESLGNGIQFKSIQIGQKHTSQTDRIHNRRIALDSLTHTILLDKTHVKVRIMCNHNTPLAKLHELRENIFNHRCIDHHIISNGC